MRVVAARVLLEGVSEYTPFSTLADGAPSPNASLQEVALYRILEVWVGGDFTLTGSVIH